MSVAAQSDMSPFFRIISVHVVILDINDNPPVFSQTEFSVNIPEDMSIGAKFPLPIAIDRDSGSNNSVFVALIDFSLCLSHSVYYYIILAFAVFV